MDPGQLSEVLGQSLNSLPGLIVQGSFSTKQELLFESAEEGVHEAAKSRLVTRTQLAEVGTAPNEQSTQLRIRRDRERYV